MSEHVLEVCGQSHEITVLFGRGGNDVRAVPRDVEPARPRSVPTVVTRYEMVLAPAPATTRYSGASALGRRWQRIGAGRVDDANADTMAPDRRAPPSVETFSSRPLTPPPVRDQAHFRERILKEILKEIPMAARRVEGLQFERVADEILAVKPASLEAHGAEPERCRRLRPVRRQDLGSDMAAAIQRRTGLPADEEIVELALAELADAGLIVLDGPESPSTISRRSLVRRLSLSAAAVMMLPVVETILVPPAAAQVSPTTTTTSSSTSTTSSTSSTCARRPRRQLELDLELDLELRHELEPRRRPRPRRSTTSTRRRPDSRITDGAA